MSSQATVGIVASLVASLVASPVARGAHAGARVEPAATGQSDAEILADKRHAEAIKAFSSGDLITAVTKFKAAYAADPSPAYLFNIGRVYEEMGELANALDYYEQFAQQPGLKLDERQQAAERIEVLRTIVPTTTPEPATTSPTEVGPDPAPVVEPPIEPPVDPEAAARARKFRIAGASLLGIGAVVGFGGGIGLGLLAANRSDAVAEVKMGENPDQLTLSEIEDLDAQGRSFELWQIVTAASGGVAAITGAVLLGLGSKRRLSPATAGLRPALRRDFAGFAVSGRF